MFPFRTVIWQSPAGDMFYAKRRWTFFPFTAWDVRHVTNNGDSYLSTYPCLNSARQGVESFIGGGSFIVGIR